MSDSWYVVAVLGLAVVGVLVLRSRANRAGGTADDRPVAAPAHRDFTQEREDARLGRMSEEDRAWQEASLQRSREPGTGQDGGGTATGPSSDGPRRDAGDA